MTQPFRLVQVVTVPMSFWLVRGHAALMARAGFEVHAISSPGPEALAYSRNEHVPHHDVPLSREMTPWADLVALVRLCVVLRRLKPRVVQAGTPKAGLLGMLAALLMRVPVRIYHMHGLPMITATGLRRVILRMTERAACGVATQILCVSHSVRDELVRARFCPPGKAIVLGDGSCNGVDINSFDPARLPAGIRSEVRDRFGIPHDAVVIGFVGRLAREKGIVELRLAWQRLREQHPHAHLLIVGPSEASDPATRDALRVLAQDSRVCLAGPDWNTAPLYAAMDVFCLPSYREGLPTVLLEAAAMELPIVAFRVPGVVDAVEHGAQGFLVEPFSADGLADVLGTYVADPSLRRRHGAEGRRRVCLKFRQEKVWAEHGTFYESIAKAARAKADAATRSIPLTCTGRS